MYLIVEYGIIAYFTQNLPHVAEVFNVKDQNEAADSKYAVVPTTESHGAVNPRTVAPTDLQAEVRAFFIIH